MKTMHGISEEDWEAYVEGDLVESERDRIEAHLTGCLVCWERYEQLQFVTAQLRAAGATARCGWPLRDEQLHAGLQRAVAKLRAQECEANTAVIRQRLNTLTGTMAEMCGTAATAKALRVAAKRSAAQTLEGVSTANWDSFLARLTSIATVICGETGAHLIRESGQL
jgi:hypothetical protein